MVAAALGSLPVLWVLPLWIAQGQQGKVYPAPEVTRSEIEKLSVDVLPRS
jgi:hypothetical protein